jgi:YjjI family glycine radical enzyme
MTHDLGERYAAVSCYNSLKIGGGSHTLGRLNLKEAVLHHDGGADAFLADTLPRFVELTAELAESRIRHLVEQAGFFDHSWLVHEGLISLDRFSAMFGVFGLAEGVDLLMEREGNPDAHYGHDKAANDLAVRVVSRVAELVAARPMPYCDGNGGRCFLHSQSGIDLDKDVTAGTRIPVGTEPPLIEHLLTVAPHHQWFAAGVSDVLAFDDTAERNPQAVVDIIRGAFKVGMRDFTFNLDSNGFVRITGYLVRKSDLEKLPAEGARHASTYLAAGSVENSRVTQRAPKRVISVERAAGAGS